MSECLSGRDVGSTLSFKYGHSGDERSLE